LALNTLKSIFFAAGRSSHDEEEKGKKKQVAHIY
jgi:hypothetical protein